MNTTIQDVRASEILDSRGNPTLSVTLRLESGVVASASVPSGASTGSQEAVELRDGDPKRYGGKGVQKAIAIIDNEFSPELIGRDASAQVQVDQYLPRPSWPLSFSPPRLGYHKLVRLLRREGWQVGRKLVQRIRREHGLRVKRWTKRPRRRGRSTGTIPTRAQGANHVWSWDFISDRTDNGANCASSQSSMSTAASAWPSG